MVIITEQLILDNLKSLGTDIKITDQSHKHTDHYEGAKIGLTHVRLHVKKPATFLNLTIVQQHQKIYTLLNDLIQNGLHAIEIIIED
jgi:stress-induced morphogen